MVALSENHIHVPPHKQHTHTGTDGLLCQIEQACFWGLLRHDFSSTAETEALSRTRRRHQIPAIELWNHILILHGRLKCGLRQDVQLAMPDAAPHSQHLNTNQLPMHVLQGQCSWPLSWVKFEQLCSGLGFNVCSVMRTNDC